MDITPSQEEVTWLKRASSSGTVNGNRLFRPAHLYRYVRASDGSMEITPMSTVDLLPASQFSSSVHKLLANFPNGKKCSKLMAQCNISNLVMHGATYTDRTLPQSIKAAWVNGNHGCANFDLVNKKQTILSSDQSGGSPAHTRLSLREQRQRGNPTVFSPPQQIMSFNNALQKPPHQARLTYFLALNRLLP